MLTIEECLVEAERNLEIGNPINRRNAGRCLADFARVVFSEIGDQYTGYQIIKNLDIEKRFKLLAASIPELIEYEPVFEEIYEIRNKTEHHDGSIPDSKQLSDLVTESRKFQKVFVDNILPSLKNSGKTPKEKFEGEWKIMPGLLSSLQWYAEHGFTNYDDLKPEIERLQGIFLESEHINKDAIQEARIDLRDLQIRIKGRLEEGDTNEKIMYNEAMADSYG